jgi:CheY-like chemotaxis protein
MSATVLVADDSKTIRQIVQMALKASEYRLLSASSGREVMEGLQKRPDIILLDYYMPDVNGYDLCRQLKTNAATQHIPVVLMGGSYRNFDENLARQAGADAIVHKPFKTDQLLEAIAAAAGKRAGGGSPLASRTGSLPTPPGAGLPTPPAPSASGLPTPPGLGRPSVPAAQPVAPPPTRPLPQPTQPVAAPPQPQPQTMRQPPTPQPAPSTPSAGAPRQSASQPRIDPAAQRPFSSGSSGAHAAIDPAKLNELVKEAVREEVQRMVREELPNLLRNIMGDVFLQRVLPRLTQHAEENMRSVVNEQLPQHIQSAISPQLDARIQQTVQRTLEQLLAEE